MDKIKIYTIDYLMTEELSDEDLDNLFSNKCLTYSLIVAMFKHINDKRSTSDIIHLITSDSKWMYKNTWTKRQRNIFEKQVTKCFENIYSYSNFEAKQRAQWWITIYGFNMKKDIINF